MAVDLGASPGVDLGGGGSSGIDLGEGASAPKKLRGQTDAPVNEDASFTSAALAPLRNLGDTTVGGVMEAAGDALAPESRSYGQILLEGGKRVLKGEGPVAFVDTAQALAEKGARDITGVQETPGQIEFRKNLAGAGAELGDAAREDIRINTPTDLNMAQRAGVSIIGSGAQMVPWLAAARAGVGRGAIGAGFVEAGALGQFGTGTFAQTYNDAKAHGASPDEAFKAAVISGGSEIITEKLGLDVLLKEGSKKFGKFLAREVGGEEVATITQSLAEKGIYNPEKWSSAEEILSDLAETALAGAGGAGAIRLVDKYALEKLEKKREVLSEEDRAAAQLELEKALQEAHALASGPGAEPLDGLDLVPPGSAAPLTVEEDIAATIEEQQRSGVIKQEPTGETNSYADALNTASRGSPGQQAINVDLLDDLNLDTGGNMSREVLERKARTEAEYAQLLPLADRPIQAVAGFGNEQQVEGLTIRQLGEIPAGAVVATQGSQKAFPTDALQPVMASLNEWVQKYMPNAKIVLNLEQLAEGEYGWHNYIDTKGGMTHIINPMEFPGAKYGGDAKTMSSVILGLSHEFGHALKVQSMYESLAGQAGVKLATKVMQEVNSGVMQESTLAALEAKAGVDAKMLREWQTQRARVLDGTMTAKEFVDSWMGVRKFAEDVAKAPESQRRYTLVEKKLGADIDTKSALDVVKAFRNGEQTTQSEIDTYLSFDEYAAEQFSRYAYAKGDVTEGAYGKWFQNAMTRLKQLFTKLKADKLIAPNVTFAAWIDQVQEMNAKSRLPKNRKARKWNISKEVIAQRAKVAQVKQEMEAARKELEAEAKKAKEEAEKAVAELLKAKDEVKKQPTRTKKDVEKVVVLQKVAVKDITKLPLAALMVNVSTMDLESRQALLSEYERLERRTNVDWTNEVEMLKAAVAELQPKATPKPKKPRATKPKPGKAVAKKEEVTAKQEAGEVDDPADLSDLVADDLVDEEVTPDLDTEIKIGKKKKLGDQWAKAREVDASQREHQDWLYNALEDVALMLTPAQYDSIRSQIDAGQLAAAEKRILKAKEKEASYDRDVSSKAFDALPKNREWVTREQLAKVLEASGYRKRELQFWQDFMLQNPLGATRDEMRAALEARQLPLVEKVRTGHPHDIISWGVHEDGLGYSARDQGPRYQVSLAAYELPADFITQPDPHFPDVSDNLIMHSRRLEIGAKRYVMELQSPYFQRPTERRPAIKARMPQTEAEIAEGSLEDQLAAAEDYLSMVEASQPGDMVIFGRVQNREETMVILQQRIEDLRMQMATRLSPEQQVEWEIKHAQEQTLLEQTSILEPRWWEDMIEREVGSAFRGGKAEVLFPTLQTADKIQGWDALERMVQDGPFAVELMPTEVRKGEANVETAQWRIWRDTLKQLVKVGPIRDRYNTEIRKFLQQKYKAQPAVDENGNTWLRVDPSAFGDRTASFDRDNSLNTTALPRARTSSTAGIENATVEEALAQWNAHGLASPMFKRWFGASQVVIPQGEPMHVWRSMGQRVTYFPDGTQGYWFSTVPADAYAMNGVRTVEDGTAQRVGQFFLKIENPLIIETDGQTLDEEQFTDYAAQAKLGGFDGVIIRDVNGVSQHDEFMIFDTEQAVSHADVPAIEDVDTVHWDRDSTSQTVKAVMKQAKKILSPLGLSVRIGSAYGQVADNLVQLQQRAHTSPEEEYLNRFAALGLKINEFKNSLQAAADAFIQKDVQMFGRTNSQVIVALEKLLRHEAMGGEQYGTPIYRDAGGNVLNPNGERLTQEMLLMKELEVSIEVFPRDQAKIAAWAAREMKWTDANAEQLDTLLKRYTAARTIIASQFLKLGQSLAIAAKEKFAGQPLLYRRDLGKTVDVIAPLLHTPFTPQGHFGKYVLLVKQAVPGWTFGSGPSHETIYRKHYEDRVEWQQAVTRAKNKSNRDATLLVDTKVLDEDDLAGLPMQLPSELLERIDMTGQFTPEQIALLQELLTSSRVGRIAERFEEKGKVVAGSSTDITRTFADFTWRNSNFIWKQHFGNQMRTIIKAARSEVRKLHRDTSLDGQTMLNLIDMKRRNIALMEGTMKYMLSPPNEYQSIRMIVTLVYLMWNIKTALMNASTMVHTLIGVQAYLGDVKGTALFSRAMKDAGWLMFEPKKPSLDSPKPWQTRTIEGALGASTPREIELIGLMERAIQDGVLDQSYAYYLAGYANQNLSTSVRGRVGQTFHAAAESGMALFQGMEKANRLVSLIAFFDMAKLQNMNTHDAYQEAVRQTNLLQNDYSSVNRPKIMRGKLALFTMFQSYAQFMGWMMTGKYEKGERARAQAAGRHYASAAWGPTAKLWLFFLAMAGYMGLPFAANLLDIVQLMYRKATGKNFDAESREFIREMGLDANLVQHGLLHNFFGFDLSGSMGLGRLFPGTDTLTKRANTSVEMVLNFMVSLTGVFGNAVKSGFEVADAYKETKDWSQALSKLPGASGAVARATDVIQRQALQPDAGKGIVTKQGVRLIWDEGTQSFRDLTPAEIGGMILGANPTARSEGMQRQYAMQSERMYWEQRRSDLSSRANKARLAGDREQLKVVMDDVRDYNSSVPHFKLKITGKDLNDAYRRAKTAAKETEKFGTTGKRYRGVVQDVGEEYR